MAKILVVDDENQVRTMICSVLERENHECSPAADAAEARMRLEDQAFDLLLCDIHMPGESGLDLMRSVRETHPDMACIMITVMDDPGLASAFLELGVYSYILKPFTPNELLIHVKNALRRRELELLDRAYKERLEAMVLERTRSLNEALTSLETAHAALRESEEKFKAIASSAQDAVLMMDADGRISFWNEAAERIFGYSEQEALGEDLHLLLAPARYLDEFRRRFGGFRKTGRGGAVGKTLELWAVRKGGQEFPVELSLSSVRIRKRWNAVAIIRDISERKRAEEALRASEEKHRCILESIQEGYYEDDLSGNFMFCNDAMARILGYEKKEEIIGLNNREYNTPETGRKIYQIFKRVYETGTEQTVSDYEIITKTGERRILDLSVSLMRDPEGEPIGFRGIARDRTEQRWLEAQLTHARKLESIGQLSAGIAHEINTPVQYIGDNIRFLREAFDDLLRLSRQWSLALERLRDGPDEKAIEELEEAVRETDIEYLSGEIPEAIRQTLEGVERVTGIVRAMKQFSHPGAQKKTPIDLNKAVESTLIVSKNEWKYVAELEMQLDPTLPLVSCYAGEVNQAILNLVINAAQAIGEVVGNGSNGKGTITVKTRRNGRWAEIHIADTGPGVPEEIRSRIFDPFFTTKEVGKGTGQGLSLAHSTIVEKHGGFIDFRNGPDGGTTFIVRLPIEDQPAALETAS